MISQTLHHISAAFSWLSIRICIYTLLSSVPEVCSRVHRVFSLFYTLSLPTHWEECFISSIQGVGYYLSAPPPQYVTGGNTSWPLSGVTSTFFIRDGGVGLRRGEDKIECAPTLKTFWGRTFFKCKLNLYLLSLLVSLKHEATVFNLEKKFN